MWFSIKTNDTNKSNPAGFSHLTPKAEKVPAGNQSASDLNEIPESLLDGVAGGINPQPLPPRGDDYRFGLKLRAR